MRKITCRILGFAFLAGTFLACGAVNYAKAGEYARGESRAASVELVRVPHSKVYFVVGLDYDLFYSDGRWWQPRWSPLGIIWWWSTNFEGPYGIISPVYVPAPVLQIPNDYRKLYYGERRIPYWEWRRHMEREKQREMREKRRERGGEFRERDEHDGWRNHER